MKTKAKKQITEKKKKNRNKMLVLLFMCPLNWTYIECCYTGQLSQFIQQKKIKIK